MNRIIKRMTWIFVLLFTAAFFGACGAQTEPTEKPTAPAGWKEYTLQGAVIYLPEEFYESDTGTQKVKMLVPKDYPEHSDNVTFVNGEGSVAYFTEKSLRDQFEKDYKDQYGWTISDYTYQKDKVGGVDRVITRFNVNTDTIIMKQTVCQLCAKGKYISVTFTNVSGEFEEVFEKALESLQMAGN